MTTTSRSKGTVRLEALHDQIMNHALDVLLATGRDDCLRIADHLRLCASDVERFAETFPPAEDE